MFALKYGLKYFLEPKREKPRLKNWPIATNSRYALGVTAYGLN